MNKEQILEVLTSLNESVLEIIKGLVTSGNAQSGTASLEFINMVMLTTNIMLLPEKTKPKDLHDKLNLYLNHARVLSNIIPKDAAKTYNAIISKLENNKPAAGSGGGSEIEYYVGGYVVTGGDRLEDFTGWLALHIKNLQNPKLSESYKKQVLREVTPEINELLKADASGCFVQYLIDKWIGDNMHNVMTYLSEIIHYVANYVGKSQPGLLNKGYVYDMIAQRIDVLSGLLLHIDKRDKKVAKTAHNIKEHAKIPDTFKPTRHEFKSRISQNMQKIRALMPDLHNKSNFKIKQVTSKNPESVISAMQEISRHMASNENKYAKIEIVVNKIVCEIDAMITSLTCMLHPDNHNTCVKNTVLLNGNNGYLDLIGKFNF